jgi:hypothetical protein
MIKQKNIFHQKNVLHVMKIDDLKKEISSISEEIVENEKDYWSKQVELFQENTKYKELLEDYDSLKKVADLVRTSNSRRNDKQFYRVSPESSANPNLKKLEKNNSTSPSSRNIRTDSLLYYKNQKFILQRQQQSLLCKKDIFDTILFDQQLKYFNLMQLYQTLETQLIEQSNLQHEIENLITASRSIARRFKTRETTKYLTITNEIYKISQQSFNERSTFDKLMLLTKTIEAKLVRNPEINRGVMIKKLLKIKEILKQTDRIQLKIERLRTDNRMSTSKYYRYRKKEKRAFSRILQKSKEEIPELKFSQFNACAKSVKQFCDAIRYAMEKEFNFVASP